jgi:hypothetical protein
MNRIPRGAPVVAALLALATLPARGDPTAPAPERLRAAPVVLDGAAAPPPPPAGPPQVPGELDVARPLPSPPPPPASLDSAPPLNLLDEARARARRAQPAEPDAKYGTTLFLNLAALAGNPFDKAVGWRVEGGVEQRVKKSARLSTAVLLSAGEAEISGYPAVLALGGTGQLRGYFLGNFDQGAYAGAQVGFWYLGGRYTWAPGALVGLKLRSWVATVDLQASIAWPAGSFGDGPVPVNESWRALAPGLLLGVGLSI